MNQDTELGPCPTCGKRAGKLTESSGGRFRYYVSCGEYVFMTAPANNELNVQRASTTEVID